MFLIINPMKGQSYIELLSDIGFDKQTGHYSISAAKNRNNCDLNRTLPNIIYSIQINRAFVFYYTCTCFIQD